MQELSPEVKHAIELLKKAVKDSHLDNQKHIDLSVCLAHERPRFQEALLICNRAVTNGELSDDELKSLLGLN